MKERSIVLKDVIDAVENYESALNGYEQTGNRILKEIEMDLNKSIENSIKTINDIQDYAALIRESAFIQGMCEGVKLMKAFDRL